MATPGRKLDDETKRVIQRLREINTSLRKTAHEARVCKRTVQKYDPRTGQNRS